MKPFLETIAETLYATYHKHLRDVYVVLPSRRSAMYFQLYLSHVVSEPIIAPNILAMDDFVKQLSKFQTPSQVELLLRLYDVYKKYDKNPLNNLERFTPLGTTLLKDFSMIDKNLVNDAALNVFDYLKEVKALERWGKELGEDKTIDPKKHKSLERYFAFWEYLEKTFADFRESLLSDGLAYSGLAYRKVHEQLEQFAQEHDIEHVVFAGFSQMTGAEEDIIRSLLKMNKASTYWDADTYYMTNRWHEAGDYIRGYQGLGKKRKKAWLEKTLAFENLITTQPKTINLVESPDELSQARYTGMLIGNTIKEAFANETVEQLKQKVNHTAILLPDGSLLEPVLQSLPDFSEQGFATADYLNLTMGISLRNSQLADLITLLFKMQERSLKGKMPKLYFDDLEHLFAHPYLRFEESANVIIQTLLNQIRKDNQVYVPLETLQEHVKENKFLTQLFTPWQGDMFSAIENLKSITEYLSENFKDRENSLDQELLFRFYTLLNNLNEAFSQRVEEPLKLNTFRYFLFELMKNQSVPFTGEPISPFQVMGMLESRTLDFEHVIILSCNEGQLPKSKVLDSVVPFGMRLENGLPTHQENDGSFAYTFYRLFHRAKKITLMYKATQGDNSDGEPSRFIQQIENEWANFPAITITKKKIELPKPSFAEKQVMEIPKDDAVLKAIEEMMARGRSPSSLNQYIKNPLDFFYKNLLKLEDPNEVEEFLDQRTFGTLLHETLDVVLKEYIGKEVTSDTLQTLAKDRKHLAQQTEEVIEEKIGKIEFDKGKNYLLKEVVIDLIIKLFKKESTEPSFTVVALEQYCEGVLTLKHPTESREIPFRVSGKADRIDVRKESGRYHLRIVDYKSGKYATSDLRISSLEQLLTDEKKEKVVQLAMYKYMLIRTLQKGYNNEITKHIPNDFSLERDTITSGFIFFRNLDDGFVEYEIKDESLPADNLAFADYIEQFLKVVGNDLLNPTKAFTEEPSTFEPHIQMLQPKVEPA